MSQKHQPMYYILAYWHDPEFKRRQGGLIRIYELADNLVDSGKRVILFLPKLGQPRRQTKACVVEIPMINFPIVRPLFFQIFLLILLLARLPKKGDFFYVRQMNSPLPILLGKVLKIKVIFEMPNDPFSQYSKMSLFKRFLVKKLDRYSMLLADEITVLSHWSGNRLSCMGGVKESKIVICPSGTNTELFRPQSKRKCCAALGLDDSCNYIGFIGTFLEHQGIDLLIEAAPEVIEKEPNIRFLLVGDGPMRECWQTKAAQLGLERNFMFTGHVKYKEVPTYIGAMDVCVAPHKGNSNQASPVKIFDYMACARPIVASDIEVVREIAAGSRCVLFFKPESAGELSSGIVSLLQNPRRRKEMGREARELAINRYDRRKIFQRVSAMASR